ncbi:hypothetical protein Tco_1095204, partial [Tanacetum coccineum]
VGWQNLDFRDFNEVRIDQERFGSSFNIQGANAFNNFISMAGLIDLPLGGYSYAWAPKSAYKMNQGRGNEEVLNHWASLMKDLNDINSIDNSDLSQKAKVCWSIEGDDNSKHFHGILNSKRSQIAIRMIPLDGD